MENQHRLIAGYQEMDQEKINLFNKITEMGQALQSLVLEVNTFNIMEAEKVKQKSGELAIYPQATNPSRWSAMAATDFQTGLMFLKRALAKPTTF